MKILIIEDDHDIAELLAHIFKAAHFSVDNCMNGAAGLLAAKSGTPDLIILDLMLPDMGGLDICKALRADKTTAAIPILVLTAKGDEIDRIVGLEVGADDYLTKPFSPRELILRVKAILRRSQAEIEPSAQTVLTFGSLELDPARFKVMVDQEEIRLTAIEFKLLHYLLSTKGRVATRDVLLDCVWGFDAALTTRTVDTHIKRLRQKLKAADAYIETIRGIGYRFKDRPAPLITSGK